MGGPIVFITEPLLGLEFTQYRVVVPLAAELASEFDVAIAAPAIAPAVATEIRRAGLLPLSGGAAFPRPRDPRDEVPSFVLSWTRDALLSLNRRLTDRLLGAERRYRINVSMTNAVPSDIWYVQSHPVGVGLASVRPNLGGWFGSVATVASPAVNLASERHLRTTASSARRIVANSGYVADWYRQRGYPVEGVIPVFLYPTTFAPSTDRPARDYILAYLGKETDLAALQDLATLGFPIKVFGGKSAQLVRSRLDLGDARHWELLGSVSHERLCDLYSNALFTAFPFTEESFGLVPVESMACGTPVLTYAAQGPAESVLDRRTGWLAPDRRAFVERAREIVTRGYPQTMTGDCLARAARYRLPAVAEEWRQTLRAGPAGSPAR